MNDPHERFRELAALALYGELDAGEAALLEEHRARCAPCRALRAALERDLGALARPAAADDLSPGWLEALRARVADEERATPSRASRRDLAAVGSAGPRAWRSFGSGLAAGLAASLLAFLAWRERAVPRVPTPAPATPAPLAGAAFARADPPPRASSPGPFAQIAALRGR